MRRRRHARPILLSALLTLAVPASAAAQPGDLDASYGGDGVVGSFANGGSGTAIGVDSHGRTILGGYTVDEDVDVAVARFRRDGSPDPHFGTEGRVRLDLGGQDYAFDLTLAPDDSILLAGRRTTSASELAFVLWLTPSGTPRASFGGEGWVTVDYGKPLQAATALALTPDGDVVIGGYTSNGSASRMAFARLHPDGSLDRSFDGDGRFAVNLSQGAEQVEDLLVAESGKVLAAGTADAGLLPRSSVLRLLVAGGLDPSFGKDGVRNVDFAAGADAAYALTQRRDGRLLVVGSADDGGRGSWGIARLTPAGTLDATFGTDGIVLLRFSPTAAEQAFAVMAAGEKVVVAGRIHTKAGGDDLGVIRLRAAGGLDAGFGGGDGKVAIDIDGGRDWATGLARMADGRIVVGGTGFRDRTFRLVAARLRA